MNLHEILETEETHSAEVGCWVVALETNLCPLLAETGLQSTVRTQQLPQLQVKENAVVNHTSTFKTLGLIA